MAQARFWTQVREAAEPDRSARPAPAGPSGGSRLDVDGLQVALSTKKEQREILKGVSFSLVAGEMHGLVGETGSGKSMTARAITGLLPEGVKVTGGHVRVDGRDLVGLSEDELREIRGAVIGMIFQNPRTALHPMLSVDAQLANIIRAHRRVPKSGCRTLVREHLDLVGIPDPDRVAKAYPHELSGGMAQRVVIAAVLLSRPSFLIADEPTTGLDATVQRQILEEIADLQRQFRLSVLMITHDLTIVAQYCDQVSVMNDGLVVEQGAKRDILKAPTHDYTKKLMRASRLEDIRA
jgi:ABC-type dipeptide/oligopeptide/nickel transport system ATPase component